MVVAQQTLWGEEETVPAGYRRVPEMGETMEINQGWADGDTSPAQLERLAALLMKPSLGIVTLHTTTGQVIWFRTIATRIEGDHVVATLERIAPLVRGVLDEDDEV